MWSSLKLCGDNFHMETFSQSCTVFKCVRKINHFNFTLGVSDPEPAKIMLTQVSFLALYGLFLCQQ